MVARALAACLVAIVAGCAGGGGGDLSLRPGQSFAVASTITPQTAAFGDPLTARLRILLDRDKIDVDSVRVLARFSPWRDITTVDRVDAGNLTALVYTIQLHCLTLSCVAFEREYRPTFGNARITSAGGRVHEVEWPAVTVVSRMPPREFVPEETGEGLDDWPPRWRAAVSLAEPSYRVSPTLLVWLLAGLGVLLTLASTAAGWRLWRRGWLGGASEVSRLDRALALLRAARSDDERRAALEALALALDAERDRELAEPARALAWSKPRPSVSAAEELAELAKETAR